MIKSFRDKETEAVYKGYQHPKFPQEIIRGPRKNYKCSMRLAI